jgi:hypothetical protein
VIVLSTFLFNTIAIMATNRKVDKTTTRSPSWQTIEKVDKSTTRSPSWWAIEKLIKLPHDRHHGGFAMARHDGDRVVVLSTFLLAAMMAIV